MNKYLMMLIAAGIFAAAPVLSTTAQAQDHEAEATADMHDIDCSNLPEGEEVPEECMDHEGDDSGEGHEGDMEDHGDGHSEE
ncbi:MAG: hypothetical protein H6853_01910 [Rhodospirillales bacterium]|nr:hypothetical protein [Alphaproteobacteria bacterium]USO04057.1 MAG: hypothetical protein H6853_01910 [Rhodospirillales bacterium]